MPSSMPPSAGSPPSNARPPGRNGSGSPFHAGEQGVQMQAGVRERAERIGRAIIRDVMPDQHREFFAQLPFILIGSLDDRGRPWASILAGPPGFAASPDPRSLTIGRRSIVASAPFSPHLRLGAPIAILGLQFETRRRNRMNGHITELNKGSFTIAVDQSFGNCAKYIQARTPRFVPGPDTVREERVATAEGPMLSRRAAELISRADTFFIASASPGAEEPNPTEGADITHHGGRPGFVHIATEQGRSVLTSPDFAGNSAFSTFGNIQLNPKASVLFVDFERGDILSLTGEAEILWDHPAIADFPGAQRFLRFGVSEGSFVEAGVPLRWSPAEPAPQIAATGLWPPSIDIGSQE